MADATLFDQVDVLAGLRPEGLVVVNATVCPPALQGRSGVVLVPASDIAQRWIGRPVPGTALLGAFEARSGTVGMVSLTAAIRQRFPASVAAANAAAAQEAFDVIAEAVHV